MNTLQKLFSLLFLCSTAVLFAQVPFPDEEMPIMDDIEEVEVPTDGDEFGYYFEEGKKDLTFKSKKGLIFNGKKITKPIYDNIQVVNPYGFIVEIEGRFGFVDTKGTEKIPLEYENIKRLGYQLQLLSVQKKGLYGVLDTNGAKVLPFKYNKIEGANGKDQFVVRSKKDVLLLVKRKGKIITKDIEKIYLYKNGAIVKSKGKFGFITQQANSGFIYDTISNFSLKKNKIQRKRTEKQLTTYEYKKLDKMIVVKEDRVGLVDTLHTTLVPAKYDNVVRTRRNYYEVQQGEKKGIFFEKCNKFIPPKYDRLYMDGMTFLQVINGSKRGLYDDATGTQILPVEYDKIYKTRNTFTVTKDKKNGVANNKGEIIIPLKYDKIDHLGGLFSSTYNGFYSVKLHEKEGVVNAENKIIIPIQFDRVGDFESGLLYVRDDAQKFGIYNLEGTVIQKPIFDFIGNERTERAKVLFTKKEGLYGAINRKGEIVLANEYTQLNSIPDVENNLNLLSRDDRFYYLALPNANGKVGVYDVFAGKFEIPVVYDAVQQTIRDRTNNVMYFLVEKEGKFGIVNPENKPVIDFQYDALQVDFTWVYGKTKQEAFQKAAVVAKKNGKYGVINFLEETLIPFEYESIAKLSYDGLFKAKKKEHYILINSENKVLNAGPFDEISHFEYGQKKALSFYNGNMREISSVGKFLTAATPMKPHKGFSSMKEMKAALIAAMDNPNDSTLYDFAQKIMPSKHLMYYFKDAKKEIRDKVRYVDYDMVLKKYYRKLLEFKRYTWNSEYFDKENLQTEDYTVYDRGITTNKRAKDWAYDDTRILEKFLRNAIKINGYWISSYFMRYNF
ncbi:MAG: WG repeat-containing protein [Bacteroidota bacterium]